MKSKDNGSLSCGTTRLHSCTDWIFPAECVSVCEVETHSRYKELVVGARAGIGGLNGWGVLVCVWTGDAGRREQDWSVPTNLWLQEHLRTCSCSCLAAQRCSLLTCWSVGHMFTSGP